MSANVNQAQIVYGKRWVEDELHQQLNAPACDWGPYLDCEVCVLTVEHDGKRLKEMFSKEQLEDCQSTKETKEELRKKVSYIVKAFKDIKTFKNLEIEYEKKYEKHLFVSERFAVREFVNKVQSLLGASLCDLQMFGSKIKGSADLYSDIDILLVIDDRRLIDFISDIAADINMEYDSNISPVIYTKTEYDKNLNSNTLFVQEVQRTGVPL